VDLKQRQIHFAYKRGQKQEVLKEGVQSTLVLVFLDIFINQNAYALLMYLKPLRSFIHNKPGPSRAKA